jgi:hypothetical protein
MTSIATIDKTIKDLLGIAVNILSKTSEDNTTDKTVKTTDKTVKTTDKTVKDLLGIALDILKKPTDTSKTVVLPESSLRIKDIVISVQQSDNHDDVLATVTPEYDGTKIKITGYKILSDSKTGSNEIIKTLGLVDINLADLNDSSKKQQIIQEVVKKLSTEYKIDQEEYQKIEQYLNKMGDAVNLLKTNTDNLKTKVSNTF